MNNKYLILAEFDDESDLYFLEQELNNNNIYCKIAEDKKNPLNKKIKVKPEEYQVAKRILGKLGYYKINKTKAKVVYEASNYNDNVTEWSEKQYDPGYFTGGNVPHFYNNPGNSTIFGLFSFIIGFPTFVLAAFSWTTNFKNRHLEGLIF